MRKLLLFITSLILFSCTDEAGTTSDIDIELAGVAGFDSVAVSNARVTLKDDENDTVVSSMVTNEDGQFLFNIKKKGNYYITANHPIPNSMDTAKGDISNILVDENTESTVVFDTLWMRRPGTIMGSVNLSGGTGIVDIFVSGTSSGAKLYEYSGNDFEIYPVWPDSNLTLVYSCDGFSTTTITGLTVLPDDTLHVTPLNLIANDVPQNVKALYDTINNTVTLSWDPMKRDDLEGYVVVRKENPLSTKDPLVLNDLNLNDTFFVDTLHAELFSQVKDSTIIDFRYNIMGITPKGRTGYSKAIDIGAFIVRDSTDVKEFISLTPDTLGLTLDGLTTTTIKWQYRGKIETIKLELTTDGGAIWTPISNAIPNNGSYTWPRVSNVQSDKCQLRITSSADDAIPLLSEFFTITMIAGEELITDGRFTQGNNEWYCTNFNHDSLIDASFFFDDQMFKVAIKQCDTSANWKIGVGQTIETQLYKGYLYQLRYKAKASVSTQIVASFSWGAFAHARYFGDHKETLSTEWQEFNKEILFSDMVPELEDEPMPADVEIRFCLGADPCDIWIDDVSLRVIGVK